MSQNNKNSTLIIENLVTSKWGEVGRKKKQKEPIGWLYLSLPSETSAIGLVEKLLFCRPCRTVPDPVGSKSQLEECFIRQWLGIKRFWLRLRLIGYFLVQESSVDLYSLNVMLSGEYTRRSGLVGILVILHREL